MQWNGGLVEAHQHHMSRVFFAQPTYATDFFFQTVIRLYCKIHFTWLFTKDTSTSCQKWAWPYFHPVANKGLIHTIMTTSRINLMTRAILLHTKLCKMYKVWCLNYILNELQVNMKNTNFVTSLLRCNQLFVEWVPIIEYFFKPTANY